jgi:hypothetical protein
MIKTTAFRIQSMNKGDFEEKISFSASYTLPTIRAIAIMIIIGTLKVTRNIVLEYQMAPKCITLCF